METLIAVCLVLLTAIHLTALVIWILLAIEARRTVQAVEVLAYRANDQVERLGQATQKVGDFTGLIRAGWFRGLAVALGAAATMWSRRKAEAEKAQADGR